MLVSPLASSPDAIFPGGDPVPGSPPVFFKKLGVIWTPDHPPRESHGKGGVILFLFWFYCSVSVVLFLFDCPLRKILFLLVDLARETGFEL